MGQQGASRVSAERQEGASRMPVGCQLPIGLPAQTPDRHFCSWLGESPGFLFTCRERVVPAVARSSSGSLQPISSSRQAAASSQQSAFEKPAAVLHGFCREASRSNLQQVLSKAYYEYLPSQKPTRKGTNERMNMNGSH